MRQLNFTTLEIPRALAVEEFKTGDVKFTYNILTRTIRIEIPPAEPGRYMHLEPPKGEN